MQGAGNNLKLCKSQGYKLSSTRYVSLVNADPLHFRSPKKSGGGMEGLCTRVQNVGKTRLPLGSVGLWATFFPLRLYVIFDFKTRHLFPVIFLLLGNGRINFGLIRNFDVTTSYFSMDRVAVQENVTSHAYRTAPEMTPAVVPAWRQHIQLLWQCNMAAFTKAEVETYGCYTNAIWIPDPRMWG